MTPTAITSTGTRQTQNLTIPSTQNTAPVLEFRCLYTHDLRRKQKRWQDGLLRFHTFNKRVMVYEVSRNYIGDLHRRDEDAVQDGDEFKLDRGVLVQVGEAMGTMEQDLTELLEKRRKPQDAESPGRAAPTSERGLKSTAITIATARSTLGQPSQLRPKSLNTLLGTSKARIGRAAPPAKSPYEHQHDNEEVENRPAKRQCVEVPGSGPMRPGQASNARLPMQFRPTAETFDQPVNTTTLARKQHDTERQSGTSKERIHTLVRRAVPDMNYLGDQQVHLGATSRPRAAVKEVKTAEVIGKTKRSASAQRPKADVKTKAKPKAKERPLRQADHDLSQSPDCSGRPPSANSTTRPKPHTEPIMIASDGENGSTDKPQREKMKLQMAARKPRKKLMYRDLLPQERSAISRSSSNDPHKEEGRRERSTSTRMERRPKDILAEYNQREQDRLADRLNKVNGRQGHGVSSEMFLTQEADFLLATHDRQKEKVPKPQESYSRPRSIERATDQLHRSPKPVKPKIPETLSTLHDTALTLSKMDEILLPKSRTSPPIKPTTIDFIIPSTPPQECSPSSIARTPPDVHSQSPAENPPPLMLVPSSPGFQTQAPKTPPKTLNDSAPTPKFPSPQAASREAPSLKPPSPDDSPSQSSPHQMPVSKPPTPPHSATLPIPKAPPPIHRPFKPPRVRSPLKKSISDTTNMGPPAPLASTRSAASVIVRQAEPVKDGAVEEGSLWTKEAWDLFGCGRDGVECSYEEFRMKEGLV